MSSQPEMEKTTSPKTHEPNMTTAYKMASCRADPQMSTAEWLEKFKATPEGDKMSNLRRSILARSFAIFDNGFYKTEDGKIVKIDTDIVEDSIKNTNLYVFKDILSTVKQEVKPVDEPTHVIVESLDSVLAAQALVKKGYKTALLNFANAYMPGGDYFYATGTQEENLCLRGSLPHTIANESREKEFYPIPVNGAIHSPNVYFYCGAENDGYPLFPEPFLCDVITSAALSGISYTEVDKEFHFKRKNALDTFNRILIILYIAYMQGCEALALGAYGCGAFLNPAVDVSALFHLAIHKYFRGVFKEISFAILNFNGKHISTNRINPKGNFIPFDECFKKTLSVEELDKVEERFNNCP